MKSEKYVKARTLEQSHAREPQPPGHEVQHASERTNSVEALKAAAGVPPDLDTGASARPRGVISRGDKIFLFSILTAVLIGIAGYIISDGLNQTSKHNKDVEFIRTRLQSPTLSPNEEANLLKFLVVTSGPQEVLFIRHVTVFLGFVVIFVGAMFVLTGIEVSYQLKMKRVRSATTLKTSSPGLVLITLGALMVLGALYRTVGVTYQPEPDERTSSSTTDDNSKHGKYYGPDVH